MPRYVIAPEVALHLAARRVVPPPSNRLLAPTLLRSQVLAMLYDGVRRGALNRAEADAQLDHLRRLRLRLLGDRVLQRVAWQLAAQLGWADTFTAESLALTRLQADAFVTLDAALARAARAVVPVATVEQLLAQATTRGAGT